MLPRLNHVQLCCSVHRYKENASNTIPNRAKWKKQTLLWLKQTKTKHCRYEKALICYHRYYHWYHHLWSWRLIWLGRFRCLLPDTSVDQRLPSICPCSHLLPVTTHSKRRSVQDRFFTLAFVIICYWNGHYWPVFAWRRVLYLVGLQFLRITGQPLDQVFGDHITWATGKRWIGRTGVLQLLPLPDAIHCPALPETGSRWSELAQRVHCHHKPIPIHRFEAAQHSYFNASCPSASIQLTALRS